MWGSDDLTGRRVAVQGLGAAGGGLARHLAAAGAELVVADIQHDRAASFAAGLRATVVDTDEILASAVDIFAPCALGAILTPDSIGDLQAQIVCGLANNQLSEPNVGDALAEAGITYVPDYVANGGGISAAGAAIYSQPTDEEISSKIDRIHDTVLEILRTADEHQQPPSIVADQLARARVHAARPIGGTANKGA
ncbi:MAG: hypothetical protein GY716_06950 [bacterium]|nr:hypothetical protein [bacterium]